MGEKREKTSKRGLISRLLLSKKTGVVALALTGSIVGYHENAVAADKTASSVIAGKLSVQKLYNVRDVDAGSGEVELVFGSQDQCDAWINIENDNAARNPDNHDPVTLEVVLPEAEGHPGVIGHPYAFSTPTYEKSALTALQLIASESADSNVCA